MSDAEDRGTPADTVDHSEAAEEIRNRRSPRTMALSCIYEEIEELRSRIADAEFNEREAIVTRFNDISHWLQARLDVEYPDCPKCGGHLGRTEGGDVICWERHHELPDHVLEEYERVDGRLWGTRGHNGGAR